MSGRQQHPLEAEEERKKQQRQLEEDMAEQRKEQPQFQEPESSSNSAGASFFPAASHASPSMSLDQGTVFRGLARSTMDAMPTRVASREWEAAGASADAALAAAAGKHLSLGGGSGSGSSSGARNKGALPEVGLASAAAPTESRSSAAAVAAALPSHYERTYNFRSGVPADKLFRELVTVLRDDEEVELIETDASAFRAKGRCRIGATSVEFRINVFRTDKGDHLVECQRWFGDCLAFSVFFRSLTKRMTHVSSAAATKLNPLTILPDDFELSDLGIEDDEDDDNSEEAKGKGGKDKKKNDKSASAAASSNDNNKANGTTGGEQAPTSRPNQAATSKKAAAGKR